MPIPIPLQVDVFWHPDDDRSCVEIAKNVYKALNRDPFDPFLPGIGIPVFFSSPNAAAREVFPTTDEVQCDLRLALLTPAFVLDKDWQAYLTMNREEVRAKRNHATLFAFGLGQGLVDGPELGIELPPNEEPVQIVLRHFWTGLRTIVQSLTIRLTPTPTICRVWRRVAREADEAGMDVPQREDLSFPRSLPEFQRLFPDDAACAAYLEKARWGDGFVCPHCQTAAEPFRFTSRPGVLRCRKCRRDTGLTAGTVMERSHTSLGVWFWAAYLVASQTPGMSATQFQRQVGLSRYETAFQILHKLRAGMVRPDQDRIGSEACDHVEVDETWVGGRTRGKGRGVHDKLLVASAVEVRQRKPGTKLDKRKGGRYAGRVRLAVVPDRSAESLCGFVEGAVTSGASVITDDWSGYTSLAKRGYKHLAVAERGNSQVAEEYLPIIHLVFSNLKTWLSGIHHGVSHQHLQAYLNEFTFRFNRRFYPFNAFRSLLGIAGDVTAPTYAELYSGDWEHPRCSGCG